MLTPITLPTSEEKVSVNACCAPSTSLLSREIRAPVWVRVKNDIGISLMCPNTRVRMSKISPSPTRDDNHLWARPRMASNMASPAMAPAEGGAEDAGCQPVLPYRFVAAHGAHQPPAATTHVHLFGSVSRSWNFEHDILHVFDSLLRPGDNGRGKGG